MKNRLFDIIFAITFIALFWWLFVVAAIGIILSDRGPILYKAKRVGLDGKIINVYKFRSMCVDSGTVRLTTLTNDERIFAFGKLIRKYKIDEFPQIFNILNGTMSVVGPRPEDVENANNLFVGRYENILSVKPGLTSPASLYDYVVGEEFETIEDYTREVLPVKMELELYYVQNRSFAYDIMLVLRTAMTIVKKVVGVKQNPPKEYYKIQGNYVKK